MVDPKRGNRGGRHPATSSPVQVTLVTLADLCELVQLPRCPGREFRAATTNLRQFHRHLPRQHERRYRHSRRRRLPERVHPYNRCRFGEWLRAGIAGGMGDLWALQVTTGTGLFTGTTGASLSFFVNLGLNDGGPYTGSVGFIFLRVSPYRREGDTTLHFRERLRLGAAP